jgi:hypothetical protein
MISPFLTVLDIVNAARVMAHAMKTEASATSLPGFVGIIKRKRNSVSTWTDANEELSIIVKEDGINHTGARIQTRDLADRVRGCAHQMREIGMDQILGG